MSYSAANGSFANLDNFGRVETVYWQDTAGSPNDLDHFAYGYDAMGNRTYRENVLKTDRSELYAHDELDRMDNIKRGTLNGAKDGITNSKMYLSPFPHPTSRK